MNHLHHSQPIRPRGLWLHTLCQGIDEAVHLDAIRLLGPICIVNRLHALLAPLPPEQTVPVSSIDDHKAFFAIYLEVQIPIPLNPRTADGYDAVVASPEYHT